MPKFNIGDLIPPRQDEPCDRCGVIGSRDFAGEKLCHQCVLDDVFDEMNERDN